MLRLHPSRCAGLPLHQLRPRPPTRVGGLGRLLSSPHQEPPRPQEADSWTRATAPSVRAVWERAGSAKQARAAVEPSVSAGSWDGSGGGPAVLLRAVHREGWCAMSLHGRRAGGYSDGAENLRGRRPSVPPLAPVPAGVRVKRVAGGRVRETRVGRTCDRLPLRALHQGLLVRRFRHTPSSSGSLFVLIKFPLNY